MLGWLYLFLETLRSLCELATQFSLFGTRALRILPGPRFPENPVTGHIVCDFPIPQLTPKASWKSHGRLVCHLDVNLARQLDGYRILENVQ